MRPSFIKTGAKFSVGTKFTWIYNFGLRSSLLSTMFIISMLGHKSWSTLQFWDQICPILGQDSQFSNIIFKINKLGLLWVQNFIPCGIYFIFGTKFSWNEGIDTIQYQSGGFNVKCVLLGCNFDFFGGYIVVTAHYLLVAACYRVITDGIYSLPLVTARSVPSFSMNG